MAAKFFTGQGVRRPARAIEVPVVRQDCVSPPVDRRRGTVAWSTTGDRTDPTVYADRQRRPVVQPGQDQAAAEGIERPVEHDRVVRSARSNAFQKSIYHRGARGRTEEELYKVSPVRPCAPPWFILFLDF